MLETALDAACSGLPNGGGHEIRKWVAECLLESLAAGVDQLHELSEVASRALVEAQRFITMSR